MFGAIAGGIASALAGGVMSKLFGGGQKSCFFFIDTATPEIYTLSLHDALPICLDGGPQPPQIEGRLGGVVTDVDVDHAGANGFALLGRGDQFVQTDRQRGHVRLGGLGAGRSEEHTSELQSRRDLVCRLLLEKKK